MIKRKVSRDLDLVDKEILSILDETAGKVNVSKLFVSKLPFMWLKIYFLTDGKNTIKYKNRRFNLVMDEFSKYDYIGWEENGIE